MPVAKDTETLDSSRHGWHQDPLTADKRIPLLLRISLFFLRISYTKVSTRPHSLSCHSRLPLAIHTGSLLGTHNGSHVFFRTGEFGARQLRIGSQ